MTFLNSNANMKQFSLIKFINETCSDDHVISKISITLRRDKIEAPYYMITKIRLTTCIDRPDRGLIHAMDILNHHRMYNLTEETYNEIRSLINDIDGESEQVKIQKTDRQLKMILMSRNDDETGKLLKDCGELFEKIDSLID